MIYYNVPKIGNGETPSDAFRPDIPLGIAWSGCECPDGTFLIGTESAIYGLIPMTDSELQNHCSMNGVSYYEVTTKWFVS